jgi:drug/metabolite transporter (DMT)-like permease
MRVKPSS